MSRRRGLREKPVVKPKRHDGRPPVDLQQASEIAFFVHDDPLRPAVDEKTTDAGRIDAGLRPPYNDGCRISRGRAGRGMLGTVNLILLEPYEMDEAGTARLTGARATHITTVLNAQVGQPLRVGRLDGPLGTGIVTSVDGATVSLACRFDAASPPRPRVDLLVAVPRPKVLRRLWSQLAALGVGRIILTNAARVERPYFDSHVLEASTYVPLLVEGLQQARDTWLPDVSVHRRFKVLVEDGLDEMCPSGVRLVAHPGEGQSIRQALSHVGGARVLLAVGPEGGWVDFERGLLMDRGFQPVELGQRPLRSDTATIALMTLAHDALRQIGRGI